MSGELFTRDGHVLDLALDRFLVDDLSPEDRLAVQEHSGSCLECARRVRQARAFVEQPLPALRFDTGGDQSDRAGGAQVIDLASRRRQIWGAVGAGAALAAAVLLFVRGGAPGPVDPGETFTARGGDLSFAVYRHDGDAAARVTSGDAVRPGDRLGFSVQSDDGGHLLIVGLDGAGSVYPGWPAGADRSRPIEGSASPVALDGAIALDATPGEERLVALRCPEPVALADVQAALLDSAGAAQTPPLREGCVQAEVRLAKQIEGEGSAQP